MQKNLSLISEKISAGKTRETFHGNLSLIPDKYKREETERCQFPDPTLDSHVLLSNKTHGNHIVKSHAEPFQLWSTSEIVGYVSVS